MVGEQGRQGRIMAKVEEGMCASCTKRKLCSSLCPEASAQVSEEYADWKDEPISPMFCFGEELRVFHSPATPPLSSFTGREREILNAFAGGFTRNETAKKLNISRTTLRVHIMNIRKKRLS